MNAADAQAHLCAYIIGRLMDMPRDEFGEEFSLVVDGAYEQVRQIVAQELRRAAAGKIRGDL